jgi:predicted nucleotidyltransferase
MADPSAEPAAVEADAVLPPGFHAAVRKLAATALENEPRVKVLLFGSRATGRSDPRSDIDLGIDVGHPIDPATLVRLREAFEELAILQKVDVVDLALLDADFRRVALQRTVLLFERQAR